MDFSSSIETTTNQSQATNGSANANSNQNQPNKKNAIALNLFKSLQERQIHLPTTTSFDLDESQMEITRLVRPSVIQKSPSKMTPFGSNQTIVFNNSMSMDMTHVYNCQPIPPAEQPGPSKSQQLRKMAEKNKYLREFLGFSPMQSDNDETIVQKSQKSAMDMSTTPVKSRNEHEPMKISHCDDVLDIALDQSTGAVFVDYSTTSKDAKSTNRTNFDAIAIEPTIDMFNFQDKENILPQFIRPSIIQNGIRRSNELDKENQIPSLENSINTMAFDRYRNEIFNSTCRLDENKIINDLSVEMSIVNESIAAEKSIQNPISLEIGETLAKVRRVTCHEAQHIDEIKPINVSLPQHKPVTRRPTCYKVENIDESSIIETENQIFKSSTLPHQSICEAESLEETTIESTPVIDQAHARRQTCYTSQNIDQSMIKEKQKLSPLQLRLSTYEPENIEETMIEEPMIEEPKPIIQPTTERRQTCYQRQSIDESMIIEQTDNVKQHQTPLVPAHSRKSIYEIESLDETIVNSASPQPFTIAFRRETQFENIPIESPAKAEIQNENSRRLTCIQSVDMQESIVEQNREPLRLTNNRQTTFATEMAVDESFAEKTLVNEDLQPEPNISRKSIKTRRATCYAATAVDQSIEDNHIEIESTSMDQSNQIEVNSIRDYSIAFSEGPLADCSQGTKGQMPQLSPVNQKNLQKTEIFSNATIKTDIPAVQKRRSLPNVSLYQSLGMDQFCQLSFIDDFGFEDQSSDIENGSKQPSTKPGTPNAIQCNQNTVMPRLSMNATEKDLNESNASYLHDVTVDKKLSEIKLDFSGYDKFKNLSTPKQVLDAFFHRNRMQMEYLKLSDHTVNDSFEIDEESQNVEAPSALFLYKNKLDTEL